MADLTPIELTFNAGTQVTQADGAASQTIPLADVADKYVLHVENTDAAPATITLKAGAFSGSSGDLSVAVAQNETTAIVVEGARFKNADGNVTVEITDADGSAFTGTVANVKLSLIKLPGVS